VVDDDPNICRLEQLYLEKENYEVRTAADGNAAVEAFRAQPPDLMILDVMLPGMDGAEVLKTVRKTGSIPVIMVTARGETFDKVLFLELGADDYMSSPLTARSWSPGSRRCCAVPGAGRTTGRET
jgi:Response regulators consisting of a CheY-like receiver domain and a winged-helix DNA-binding domain